MAAKNLTQPERLASALRAACYCCQRCGRPGGFVYDARGRMGQTRLRRRTNGRVLCDQCHKEAK